MTNPDQNFRCSKCVLPNNFQNISFEDGVCSYCREYKPFIPNNEENLLRIFTKAKKKKRIYDALVPLSGGKDSTYVLYLATKKYKLNVLAFTFDNGFVSKAALENINNTISNLHVDHIFVKPDFQLLRKLYRASLLLSGELCSICGIGIVNNYLKLSETYQIPLILTGDKVTETNSIQFEKIYDTKRMKTILENAPDLSIHEINRFLVYPRLHPYTQKYKTYLGKFGRVIHPLFYQQQQNDDQIGEFLTKELNWIDAGKHADCVAEAFSNYIREHRYGYSRRVAYLSNKTRMGEISRDEALAKLFEEKSNEKSNRVIDVMNNLELTDNDLETVIGTEKHKFQSMVYKQNRYVNKAIKIFEKYFWE